MKIRSYSVEDHDACRRDMHGQGIGRLLLRHRLNAIQKDGRAQIVQLRTVQLVQGFFERAGFEVVDVVRNGYGEGLDRLTMVLEGNHER